MCGGGVQMWITSPRKLAFVVISAMLLVSLAAACGEPEVAPQDKAGLLALVEVDEPEKTGGQQGSKSTQAPGIRVDRYRDIDAALRAVGALLVPSYTPEGFEFDDAVVTTGRDVTLFYYHDQAPSVLSVGRNFGPATLRIKRGSSEEVSIEGRPGHLIRGGWKSANGGTTTWDHHGELSVLFEREDHWVRVAVLKPDRAGVDEDELLRVAESLVPYESTIRSKGQDTAPGVAAVDTPTQSQSPDTVEAAADEAQEPPISLDDIKAEFGVLYLPSYLPPGFTLYDATITEPMLRVMNRNKATFVYSDTPNAWGSTVFVIFQNYRGFIPSSVRQYELSDPEPLDLEQPPQFRRVVDGLKIYFPDIEFETELISGGGAITMYFPDPERPGQLLRVADPLKYYHPAPPGEAVRFTFESHGI